jgi:hypothetical protein
MGRAGDSLLEPSNCATTAPSFRIYLENTTEDGVNVG